MSFCRVLLRVKASPQNDLRDDMVDSKMVVSVVDDDDSVRRAMKRLLSSFGYDVEVFASAADFLVGSSAEKSVLVLDVQMPGMDGLELYNILSGAGANLPVIFITAHENPEVKAKAMQAGAVAFLQKPFDDKALLDAIDRGKSFL
ncbi:MAG: response regulator transcription factor [Syntrophobacteraceae bacterium]